MPQSRGCDIIQENHVERHLMTSGNNAVDQIGTMNITGNVIPPIWCKKITYASGKPCLNAIFILADFVYWYRPKEVRDEITGQLIGYKKRFKADMLQRKYEDICDQFGLSKKQVREAIDILVDIGVVRKELRTITVGNMKVSNVTFFEVVPEKLYEITFTDEKVSKPAENKGRAIAIDFQGNRVFPSRAIAIDAEVKTNTEITTETNTEIINQSIYPEENEKPVEGSTDGLIDGSESEMETVEEISDSLGLSNDSDYESFRGMMSPEEFENYKEIPSVLAEMICDRQARTYNGCFVSHGSKVRLKVKHVISRDEQHNLTAFGIRASKNFLNACITKPPKNPVAYFKSVLWSALSNYTLEDNAEFVSTYHAG